MLWHEKTGLLMVASMNEYQMFEAGNQQIDNDPNSIALTPRIELKLNGSLYMNISDLNATMDMKDESGQITVTTHSKLVDKDQKSPATGDINCKVIYNFSNEKVTLKFSHDKADNAGQVKIIFPVIAKSNEKLNVVTPNQLIIHKDSAQVKLSANHPITQLPSTNGRVLNFVPGYEAIPFYIAQNDAVIELEVRSKPISRKNFLSRFPTIPGHQ
jgi:hypothetical protein